MQRNVYLYLCLTVLECASFACILRYVWERTRKQVLILKQSFTCLCFFWLWANFMESVTVSKKWLLTMAENSTLMVSVFHGLVRNLGWYACVRPITKDSLLTGLVQNFFTSSVSTKLQAISTEFSSTDSMKLGPNVYSWEFVSL